MAAMMPRRAIQRGPERLIFDSATVLADMSQEWRGDVSIITIRFIQQPNGTPMIRESMDPEDVRMRTTGGMNSASIPYNGDAVYWLRRYDAEVEKHTRTTEALVQSGAQLDALYRDYEASKNLWRKPMVVADACLEDFRRTHWED